MYVYMAYVYRLGQIDMHVRMHVCMYVLLRVNPGRLYYSNWVQVYTNFKAHHLGCVSLKESQLARGREIHTKSCWIALKFDRRLCSATVGKASQISNPSDNSKDQSLDFETWWDLRKLTDFSLVKRTPGLLLPCHTNGWWPQICDFILPQSTLRCVHKCPVDHLILCNFASAASLFD